VELRSGTWTVGPAEGSLVVRTKREGAAARMGHDLTLTATRWHATVSVDSETPDASTVRAIVDSSSLVVTEATGGAIGLSASQKIDVETNIREKVLHSEKHPQITFSSTSVSSDPRGGSVSGDLTLAGKTRPLTLAVRLDDSSGNVTASATTSIVQSEFGMKPYSAMLGGLKVRDVVELSIDVTLPRQ
jgi:polyisoprenoid-binding protein YceI